MLGVALGPGRRLPQQGLRKRRGRRVGYANSIPHVDRFDKVGDDAKQVTGFSLAAATRWTPSSSWATSEETRLKRTGPWSDLGPAFFTE